MSVREFGRFGDEPVHEVTIRSAAGAVAKVITWGAVLRDLVVPGPSGPQRVVLGFDDFDHYPAHSPHFGATAGRYANRIAGGRFTLDGVEHQVDRNQAGRHALHGGRSGFGKRMWRLADHDERSVTLSLVSADGDGGYPGALTTTCVYRLEEPGTLRVELTATTTAATIVNLAHHSYWNLDGAPTILDHEIEIAAAFITPVDQDLIPTGELLSVADTPFDFRRPRPIRLERDGTRVWYDHNFVLTTPRPDLAAPLRHAVTLRSPRNGLAMQVHTTEPGVQFYDGHKIALDVPGLDGVAYLPCAGLALEPQVWPDSPNRPHFPDPTLRPGEVYRQVTEYRFG